MQDTFSVALISFVKNFGSGWIFLISVGIIFLYSVFEIIFIIFIGGKKKVLISHFILLLFLSLSNACLNGLSLLFIKSLIYPLFMLAVGMLFIIPVYLVDKREKKIGLGHKKLIEFIDDKILKMKEQENVGDMTDKDVLFKQDAEEENFSSNAMLKKQDNNNNGYGKINFMHVKNVISKLDNINLSNADLRQVKDLKTNVYLAENGGMSQELKEKINDGLGALLKIMAKYGI